MLRIGELAAKTGFTPKTLRYYEEVGVLRVDRRSEAGYRLYGEAAVERLGFVRWARGLGLRLDDIRRILEITDEGGVPCEHTMAVVDRELDRIAQQMEMMGEIKRRLEGLRSRVAEALASGAARPNQECPCFQHEGVAGPDPEGDQRWQ